MANTKPPPDPAVGPERTKRERRGTLPGIASPVEPGAAPGEPAATSEASPAAAKSDATPLDASALKTALAKAGPSVHPVVPIVDEPSTSDTPTRRREAATQGSRVIEDPSTEDVDDAMVVAFEAKEDSAVRARPPVAPRRPPPAPALRPSGAKMTSPAKVSPAARPARSATPAPVASAPVPSSTPKRSMTGGVEHPKPLPAPAAMPKALVAMPSGAPRAPNELRAGTRLPASFTGYELLMPVAKGGMAAVWAARARGSAGFHRLVAVKTLRHELSDDPDFQTMFLDEARVAARIRHPNVADLLDFGDYGGLLYLVMEWVEGESLAALRKAARPLGGIPMPVVLRIALGACAGLHAAHELRDESGNLLDLVHRDISPPNVLVSNDGVVKVVDFGIAKSKARVYFTSDGNLLKGKASYLSPEQVAGMQLDRRSDIFSFGTMLYSLATGRHPFRGETELKTAENVVTYMPPRPRALVSTIHPHVDAIIMRALEKDPARRFASALDLHHAITEANAAAGRPPTDADVAAFVDKVIGERLSKRATKLRATVRAFEEAEAIRASVSPPGESLTPAPGEAAEELWLADEDEVTLDGVIAGIRPLSGAPTAAASDVREQAPAAAAAIGEPPFALEAALGRSVDSPDTDELSELVARSRSRRFVPLLVAAASVAAIGLAVLFSGMSESTPAPGAMPPAVTEGARQEPRPPPPPIAAPGVPTSEPTSPPTLATGGVDSSAKPSAATASPAVESPRGPARAVAPPAAAPPSPPRPDRPAATPAPASPPFRPSKPSSPSDGKYNPTEI
jgi:serine/threonine protein kinase